MAANILAKRHAPTLARFAASNVLLAFDYDGTLAPIVAKPGKARMRARTRRLLTEVALRYPCVVISGRSRADVARRVDMVPAWLVSGNHGVEPWGQSARYAAQVRKWVRHLDTRLAAHQGVDIEDKRYSVAIHYRRSTNKPGAIRAIEDAVRSLKGTRMIAGKQSVSLVPEDAPHKGVALERARRLLGCDTAVYIGDDETDEDAFAAGPPNRLLSIRVGTTAPSRAAYRLKDQRDIDALLERLLRLRRLRRKAAG